MERALEGADQGGLESLSLEMSEEQLDIGPGDQVVMAQMLNLMALEGFSNQDSKLGIHLGAQSLGDLGLHPCNGTGDILVTTLSSASPK